MSNNDIEVKIKAKTEGSEDVKALGKTMGEMAVELGDLSKKAEDIDAYKKLGAQYRDLSLTLKEAEIRAFEMKERFGESSGAYSVAQNKVESLTRQIGQNNAAWSELGLSLKARGIDVRNLDSEQAKLQKSLADTAKSVTQLKSVNEAYSTLGVKSSRDVAEEIQKQRQAYETLKNSGTASYNDLIRAHTAMSENIKKQTNETSLLGQAWKSMKADVAIASTAIAAGITAVGYAAFQAFQKYSEFATGMAQIYTLVDGPREKLNGLEKQIMSLSVTYGMSGKELQKAGYDILSSGIALKDTATVLELSAKAAAAGITDISETAAAGVGVLNAYGKSAGELGGVLDTMFQAVKDGVFTFPELSKNIGDILPTARAAGVSFEEVTGALAQMTQAGMKTPQAATALKGAINAMAAPAPEAKKVFDELGVTWNGLIPTLEELRKKGLDLDGLRMLIPDVEARTAVLSMIQNMDNLHTILGHVNNAAGATQEAWKKIADTPEYKVKQLKTEFDNLKVSIGKDISDAALGSITTLKELNETLQLNQKDISTFFKSVITLSGWAIDGVVALTRQFSLISEVAINAYASILIWHDKSRVAELEGELAFTDLATSKNKAMQEIAENKRKEIEQTKQEIAILENVRKLNMDSHNERTSQEEEHRKSIEKTIEADRKKIELAKEAAIKAAEVSAEQSAQLIVLAEAHAKVNAQLDEGEKKQTITHSEAIARKTEEDKKYYAAIVDQMTILVKKNGDLYGKDSQQYKDAVEAKKKAQAALYAVYTSEQNTALKSLYDSYQRTYAKIDELEKSSSVTHLEASRLKSAEDVKYYENKASLLTRSSDDALRIYGKDSKEFRASVDAKVQAQKRLFDAQDQEQAMLLKQLEKRQLEIDLAVAKEYKSKADGIKEKLRLEEDYDKQAIESAKKRLEQTDELIKSEVKAHGIASAEILEERKKLVEKIDALENAALKNKIQIVTAEKEEEKKANEESAKAIKKETDAVDENTAAKDKNSKAVADNAEKKKETMQVSVSVSSAQEQEAMTLDKLNSSIEFYQSLMRLKIKPMGIGGEIDSLKATRQEYENLIAEVKQYGWELDASNLTLEQAKTKVDELKAKYTELNDQIVQVQKNTDQTIRELNRRNMTPEEVHKDMQAEYNEKMAEASRLSSEKNYTEASKLYLEAQKVAERLAEEVKSVSGQTIATLEETTAAAAELMRRASAGAVEAIRLQREELGKLQDASDKYSQSSGNKNSTWMTGSKLGFASGGKLPGFGWTDTVPAMLTPGERITNAYSTRLWDSLYPGLMDAINSTRSESDAKKIAGAFALGPVFKFNTGGLVPDWNFNIPSMPSSLLSGSGGSAVPTRTVEVKFITNDGNTASGIFEESAAELVLKELRNSRRVS